MVVNNIFTDKCNSVCNYVCALKFIEMDGRRKRRKAIIEVANINTDKSNLPTIAASSIDDTLPMF